MRMVSLAVVACAHLIGPSIPCILYSLVLIQSQVSSDLHSVGLLLLNFVAFLLPGFGLVSWLHLRRAAPIAYPLILILITSAFLGYLSFFTFLFSKLAGRVLVLVIYLGSLALIGFAIRSGTGMRDLLKQVAEPLAITAVTTLCYFSFTFQFIDPMTTGAGYVNGRFSSQQLPGDNRIPFFFAERLYDRQPLRPFCCGGWLSSDRPPLQAGIFLLERPLSLTSNVELDYELLAIGLQCLWICGVWCLLKSLGTSLGQIRRVLCFLIFSGAIFFNSVYTWPKLLTATLVLFAVSILITVVRSRLVVTYFDISMAAVCLGLALVSHPGSLFTLVGITMLLFRFRTSFPFRKLSLAAPIVLTLLLPWSAYQRFIDPPGNRLIKLHLAGDNSIGPSTSWESIQKAYRTHSWREIAGLRWSNIAMLAGYKPFDTFGRNDLPSGSSVEIREWNRTLQERYLWNALGPLNFGWLAGLFLLFRKRESLKVPHSGWMLLAVVIDILVWCLVEFGPYFSLIAHLSFADFLILNIVLVAFVLELPSILLHAILALQFLNFFVVWVWSPPYALSDLAGHQFDVRLQFPLLFVGLLLSMVIVGHLGRSGSVRSKLFSRP